MPLPARCHFHRLTARVRTCAGRGRMPMFRPQAVSLRVGGRWQSCRAMIAAAPKGYDGMQALVPAQLIQ